jgi:hypothetical protein
MTVLIETSLDPPAELAAELAWCLERFVNGRADEPAMRRASEALKAWDAWSDGAGRPEMSPGGRVIDLRAG